MLPQLYRKKIFFSLSTILEFVAHCWKIITRKRVFFFHILAQVSFKLNNKHIVIMSICKKSQKLQHNKNEFKYDEHLLELYSFI